MSADRQFDLQQEAPGQLKSSGENTAAAPPAFSLSEEPAQMKFQPHGNGCDCTDCGPFVQMKKPEPKPDHGGEDEGSGGGTVQLQAPQGELENSNEQENEIQPSYSGKDFTVGSKGAQLLTQGLDKYGITDYNAEKTDVGQDYPFAKLGNIPKGAKVTLQSEAVSYDNGKNKPVAQVKVESVPEGAAQEHVGKIYWTTRSNISEAAGEDGQYTVTDKAASIRSEPVAVKGYEKIPSGTTIQVTDTRGIDEFPESIRLKNNSERDAFHKNRYMRLYLQVSWTDSEGKQRTGWISANDVEGGFANEVLGTAEIPEGSLESDDPSHMTVGTAEAPLLKKGAMNYESYKKNGDNILQIAQGTYVQILATSADGKYVQVSSEDNSVNSEWTSKGNLDLSKKKTVGEGDAGLTFYEVTDSKAYIRQPKQGYTSTGSKLVLGDYVKVHQSEEGYALVAKVTRNGEERTESEDKNWVESARLAPGWSTDLKGPNASWGVEVIGGQRLTKYKGQDEFVNLGGSGGKMKQVSKEAYPNLMRMINAAQNNKKADGTSDPIPIEINSCFRTFFSQKYFDDNENKPGFNDAAPPGRSDHQDSNAFDLNNKSSSKIYQWLKDNAWKYDIVQNVQKSNERHHWAYIPGGGKEGYYTTWGTKSTESW